MVVTYKQELPPPGGFDPVQWAKRPVKGRFRRKMLFLYLVNLLFHYSTKMLKSGLVDAVAQWWWGSDQDCGVGPRFYRLRPGDVYRLLKNFFPTLTPDSSKNFFFRLRLLKIFFPDSDSSKIFFPTPTPGSSKNFFPTPTPDSSKYARAPDS